MFFAKLKEIGLTLNSNSLLPTGKYGGYIVMLTLVFIVGIILSVQSLCLRKDEIEQKSTNDSVDEEIKDKTIK